MREILFRAKRLDNGEWVEGAYCPKNCDSPFGPMIDKPSIIKLDDPFSGFWFDVHADSIGQYTGLTDKNGKKIFEGDTAIYGDDLVVIEWHDEDAMFYTRGLDGTNWTTNFNEINSFALEIFSNIHDTPELLEG